MTLTVKWIDAPKRYDMSLIRVFEIPKPNRKYCFGAGVPQSFVNVDWFRDDHDPLTPDTVEEYKEFIKRKSYFSPHKSLLVLHPTCSFTMGYDPDAMMKVDRP